MTCSGEAADVYLCGVDAVCRSVLPHKADRSCEVSHRLFHDGYAAELVGRVSHDEAVIAKLVKSLGDEFSFGRDNDSIAAAGEDQHAWMCGTVVDEIRP